LTIDGGASFSPKSIGLPGGETANHGLLQDVAETWFPINLGLGGNTHDDVSISGLELVLRSSIQVALVAFGGQR